MKLAGKYKDAVKMQKDEGATANNGFGRDLRSALDGYM